MKFGAGYSTLEDPYLASKTATKKAVVASGKPDLTLVFSTVSYQQEKVLEAIKSIVGDSKIAGCSAGDVIFDEDVYDRAVVIATINVNGAKVATSMQEGISKDSYGAGQKAGEELRASGIESGLIIVLADGTTGNKTEVIWGLYNAMGPDYTYLGGGSGSSPQHPQTYQFTEKGVKSDAVAVALLEGVSVHAGLTHGWKPSQNLLVITAAKGKTVYEIDGRPAFDVYSELLGCSDTQELIKRGKQYPLGIPDASGNYVIRDPKLVNDDKSIDFVSEIPEKSLNYVMEGSIEEQIDADKSLVESIFSKCKNPELVILLDCTSRTMLLGEHFKEEMNIIRQSVDRKAPIIGALTFGEIGSYTGLPMFHNKTVCLAALSNQ